MKVLQVCLTHPPEFSGGSSLYAVTLGQALVKRGFHVEFLCGTNLSSIADFEIQKNFDWMYPVYRIGLPARKYGRNYVKRLSNVLCNFFEKNNISLIQLHSTDGLGEGIALAARQKQIPVILTVHEGGWICPNLYFRNNITENICRCSNLAKCIFCRWYGLRYEKLRNMPRRFLGTTLHCNWVLNNRKKYLNQFKKIIAVCNFIKSKYIEFGVHTPYKVIKNRINEQEILFKNLKSYKKPLKFGLLGAFRPKKGGDLFIRSLTYLYNYRLDFEIHIWGSTEANFTNILKKNNYFFIKNHGYYEKKDLNKIFSSIDVLVYPSCSGDTYPLVLLESLASRTPIIAANTHGMSEIIINDLNGKSFEPLNPQCLAEQMISFIKNPDQIIEIQRKIQPPENYSTLVDETIELYDELFRINS